MELYLTKETAEKLLRCEPRVSFDLGISQSEVDYGKGEAIVGRKKIQISAIRQVARAKRMDIFMLKDGKVSNIAVKRPHDYSLVLLTDGYPPTISINGTLMHPGKEYLPGEEENNLVKHLEVKPGEEVLDVCTGLGYCAAQEAECWGRVTTIEMDRHVVALARHNPYSRRFFEQIKRKRIKLMTGDATRIVKRLRTGKYDKVMHDPPRYTLAPELYSPDFYKELFRVMKRGGRLVHNTGNPRSSFRKKGFIVRIEKMLKRVGFVDVGIVHEMQAVIAKKPA